MKVLRILVIYGDLFFIIVLYLWLWWVKVFVFVMCIMYWFVKIILFNIFIVFYNLVYELSLHFGKFRLLFVDNILGIFMVMLMMSFWFCFCRRLCNLYVFLMRMCILCYLILLKLWFLYFLSGGCLKRYMSWLMIGLWLFCICFYLWLLLFLRCVWFIKFVGIEFVVKRMMMW